MTTVEQALAASRNAMTVLEIGAATGIDPSTINDHLRAISDAGNLEYIPARGHHAKSYALKRIPAATAEPKPGVGCSNPGSDWSGSLSSPEAVAVAIENPGPDAGSSLSAEGPGRNVWLSPEMQYLAQEDYELPPADPALLASANRLLVARVRLLEQELDDLREAVADPAGFLLIVPKRNPRLLKTHGMAQALAMAAVRNGAKRAEVFALVRVGVAKKGAEWRES